jgi:hypothetical protein
MAQIGYQVACHMFLFSLVEGAISLSGLGEVVSLVDLLPS